LGTGLRVLFERRRAGLGDEGGAKGLTVPAREVDPAKGLARTEGAKGLTRALLPLLVPVKFCPKGLEVAPNGLTVGRC